tara:strand:+ start:58 stop:795 length:738 start_codon:yes stop_codon:yes gene_type:complete
MRDIGFSVRNSEFFAKLSMDAYLDVSDFAQIYFKDFNVKLFDTKGTQCFALWDDTDLMYIFRGTEPTKLADIAADLKFRKVDSDCSGKVHRGFKGALDVVWDDILEHYNQHKKDRNLFFSGHSLGAALATLAAARLGDENTTGYTYGSPRVGDINFSKAFKPQFFRFKNNNDVVTRHPLEIVGFRHVGHLNYFDHNGIHKHGFSRMYMIKQYVLGMLSGFKKFEIDSFCDHSSSKYYALCAKMKR